MFNRRKHGIGGALDHGVQRRLLVRVKFAQDMAHHAFTGGTAVGRGNADLQARKILRAYTRPFAKPGLFTSE